MHWFFSLELKKILQTKVLGVGFAFNVENFGCCRHIKCQDRSWISLYILAVSEVVPVLQRQPVSQAGRCDSVVCPWTNLAVMSSLSVLIYVCLGRPNPIPLQLARPQFAAPVIAGLKVFLLWVHLFDKFLWLETYLLLEFIPLWFASLAVTFPGLFSWKLHSCCLNLQNQIRRNYLERLLCELFFLYIFQIYIANSKMKVKK